METYRISKEMLLEAETYLPLAEKEALCARFAPLCFDEMKITATVSGSNRPIPLLFKENAARKSRFLMGLLIEYYLKTDVSTEESDDYLMTVEEYDRWARQHPLNHIERMKADAVLRDICFDLLQDYKAFEKMLNAELYGQLQAYNDVVARAELTLSAALAVDFSPENVQKLTNVMKEMESVSKRKQISQSGNVRQKAGRDVLQKLSERSAAGEVDGGQGTVNSEGDSSAQAPQNDKEDNAPAATKRSSAERIRVLPTGDAE